MDKIRALLDRQQQDIQRKMNDLDEQFREMTSPDLTNHDASLLREAAKWLYYPADEKLLKIAAKIERHVAKQGEQK